MVPVVKSYTRSVRVRSLAVNDLPKCICVLCFGDAGDSSEDGE